MSIFKLNVKLKETQSQSKYISKYIMEIILFYAVLMWLP